MTATAGPTGVRVVFGETTRVDLGAKAAKAYSISGRIQLPQQNFQTLDVRVHQGYDMVKQRAVKLPGGEFDIPGVPPGDYTVDFLGRSDGVFTARIPVTIRDQDLTDIRATLARVPRLRAVAEIPDTSGVEFPGVSQLAPFGSLTLVPLEPLPFQDANYFPAGGAFHRDGTVVVNDVAPGRYAVEAYSRGTLVSITAGGVDVLRDGITVTAAGAPDLRIRFVPKGGELEVRVKDDHAQVVLLPKQFNHSGLIFAYASKGVALFHHVPPGGLRCDCVFSAS